MFNVCLTNDCTDNEWRRLVNTLYNALILKLNCFSRLQCRNEISTILAQFV